MTELGGSLEDVNFFGFGKQFYAEGVHETDVGFTWSFSYSDPQLFGSRWIAGAGFSTGPLLKSAFVGLSLPFISLDSKWSYGMGGFISDETQRLFEKGEEVSRLKLEMQGASVSASRAFGKRFRKRRLEISYNYLNRDFSPLGDLTTTPLPDDELTHTTSASFTLERISYVEAIRIDKFVRTEDFRMGAITDLTIGRSGFPITKGEKRWDIFVQHQQRFHFIKQYLFLTGSFESEGFEKNTILSFTTRYYNKMFKRQTLALNMNLDVGRDLETNRQFLLGGDNGLRGYPAREFSGDKRILMNVESRIFPPLNILTVELGGVAFVDAGHVWNRGQSIDFADLNYSVGFGFRFGYTKAPGSPVGRLDFGYPINRGGGIGISLGVGQQFSAR